MKHALLAGILLAPWAALRAPADEPPKPAGQDADAPGAASSPAPERPPAPPDGKTSDDVRRQEILNKLQNLKVDLDFTDAPLVDVIDFIRDFAQINIFVDPRVYEQSADKDMKVTIKVHDLVLRSALKLMLGGKNLSAMYKDGVLLILPKEEIKKAVSLRIYDVRDLLHKIEDFPGPVVELKPPGQNAAGGISGATFTLDEPKSIITEDFLLDIIKKNTGNGDWDANPNASIQLSNGLLMVVQSPPVHAEIDRLLGQLRAYK